MTWKTIGMTCALGLLLLTPAGAAEGEQPEGGEEMAAMMAAWQKAMTPGDQHANLAKATGSWEATIRTWMDPAAEPMVSKGTVERKMTLGGRILEEHLSSEMMGQPFTGVGRVGYDNVTGRHWSTWTDSMSTGIYLSYGSEDADGSISYAGEYQDPMSGGMIKSRAVVRWVDENTQLFEWHEDRGEGEIKTMEITYRRAQE